MDEPSDLRFTAVESPVGADSLRRLRREINRLFDDLSGGFGASGEQAKTSITPPINVAETDQAIYLDAELTGVRDADVHVDLFGDRLTIHGGKAREHADAQRHLAECSFGAFTRSVRLPFAPRPDDVNATLEHGVLHVVLPKPTGHAGTHHIPVHGVSSARAQPTAARGCFGGNAALAGHPTEDTCGAGTAQSTSR